jgi:hypothetical protein
MMKSVRLFIVLVLLIFTCSILTYAQAPGLAQDPSTVPSGSAGQWQLGAGYSSVSGPTNNGQFYFVGKQVGNRSYGIVKVFSLANFGGVTIIMGSPRYQLPFNAFWKSNQYLDTSKFAINLDGNLGVAKDAIGTSRLAYGAGVGLDYKAASTVTVMLFEADFIRSKMFPQKNLLLFVNNLNSISTGIRFTF